MPISNPSYPPKPPKTPPHLKLLRQGLLALLRYDYVRALTIFQTLYQDSSWLVRDLGLTGLADMLDVRIVTGAKKPNTLILANWQPPSPTRLVISAERLAVLVENYLQPHWMQPRTLTEHRLIRTLQKAQQLLENSLLYDPHHLVRMSSLLILSELFCPERRNFIETTLQRAYRRESYPDLKQMIGDLLAK